MLELNNVSAYYVDAAGIHTAFEPVNLQVSAGEIVTVLGPSGCGKTSLIRAIAGLNDCFDGAILINGKALNSQSEIISYIPSGNGILKYKTMKENILFPYKIRNIPVDKETIFRLHFLAGYFNIENVLDQYPAVATEAELLGGALARGFILEPDILLMDDPFCGLEPYGRETAQKKLKHILSDGSTATLLVTNNIEEAIFLGNRVIVFSPGTGRIIADITALHSMDEDRHSSRFYKLVSIVEQLIKRDWRHGGYEKIQNIS